MATIVHRPRRHFLMTLLMLASIPIFLLNIWVLEKGAISKILTPLHFRWMGIQAAVAILAMYWTLKAKLRGVYLFMVMAATILGANLYFLVATKNYALAFYALFVVIVASLHALHLYKALGEAYYRSGKRWYEGMPPFLSRVEAELHHGDQTLKARISRLGDEGCYAFIKGATVDPTFLRDTIDPIDRMTLHLGELSLDCKVELVIRDRDGMGCGIRFIIDSQDESKDIRDFIDRVRSAGYVS